MICWATSNVFFVVQLFDNMKKNAKKSAANEKVARKKTGGGSCEVNIDLTTEKVLAVLGNRAKPLINLFDGDTEYNGDTEYGGTVIGK